MFLDARGPDIGGLVWLGAHIGIPLGRLPGDVHLEGQNASFHSPLVSSIMVSVILMVLLNVILRLMNK